MKNMLAKPLKAIFLDFDGVVVESVDIKTQAFYDLYLPYGVETAEQAKAYHLQHQGISRNRKFEEISKHLFQKNCDDDEKEKLSEKFSNLVLQKILECPFVEGVMDFLEYFKTRQTPVFLLSATPQEELISICEKRNLLKYFKGVYGSPHQKSTIGEKIINEGKLKREEIVFIGDSLSDYKAASILKLPFIGRVGRGTLNPFDDSVLIIENFNELSYAR